MKVVVHNRVFERHPDITEADVQYAWSHYRHFSPRLGREPMQYMVIGFDMHARPLELLAVVATDEGSDDRGYLVFHAMRCTKAFAREMRVGQDELNYLFGGNQHGIHR